MLILCINFDEIIPARPKFQSLAVYTPNDLNFGTLHITRTKLGGYRFAGSKTDNKYTEPSRSDK